MFFLFLILSGSFRHSHSSVPLRNMRFCWTAGARPPERVACLPKQRRRQVSAGVPVGPHSPGAVRVRRMKVSSNRFVRFAIVAVLVFSGINLPFLMGGVSTGPNVDYFLGVTGWLCVHRGGNGFSVEHIYFSSLTAELCLAVSLTWILSKALPGSRKKV